jgi:phytoene dehydrogenase-like protein
MAVVCDVIVIGAGHNGLVAATVLARHGLDVVVVEARDAVGGAAKTEYPFAMAPGLGASTGAYLLGVMPPELLNYLGATLGLRRRDPHYFLPTFDHRYLLVGSDDASMRHQCRAFFSEEDWHAASALTREIEQIRDDLAPAWLAEPRSLEDTAEQYLRPSLRQVFLNLARQPVEAYLDRFGFRSELIAAMYAATDGFSGLHASYGSAGTGLNFLVHNMCRLPGADGTWMIVTGGMGAVTRELARLATAAGARLMTNAAVSAIVTRAGCIESVALEDGRECRAPVMVSGTDPFRLRDLVGRDTFPAAFNEKLDGFRRSGTTLKVNLALDRLPVFSCLPEDRGQHQSTIHLLPQAPDVIAQVRRGFDDVRAGQLADFPVIEWYTHTVVDPSMRDAQGRHSAAMFVQWVPYTLSDGLWETQESRYVSHLLDIVDRFAPGTSAGVADVFTLTPPKIEQHFGVTGGHIHHVDNSFGFDQRMPYATPVAGLYACSAACHPAGSVIGSAGYIAATRVLKDLGVRDIQLIDV